MSFYPKIARNVILPLGDFVMNTSISKHLRFLEKSQWWSLEKLQEYQKRKMRSLMKHAYENVPYYHKVFRQRGVNPDDINTIEDLNKLPILTKEIIREKFNDLKATNLMRQRPLESRTGGTTGIPLRFYYSKDAWSIIWAANYRAYEWIGYEYGDRMAVLGGSSLIPNGKISLAKTVRTKLENQILLSAAHMSKETMKKHSLKMKKTKPKFLRGYPSSIYHFSNYLKENEIIIPTINGIVTTAEVLFQYHRQVIEDAFNCKIFNEYGCRDGGGKANECEVHNGLHISPEVSIMEFLSINNHERVTSGERGVIVLTDLHNFSMPFIRYTPEDEAIPSDEKCTCQRGLPLMKSLEGKTTDIITFSNGISLGGPAFTLLFKDFNIKEYQLVQEKRDFLVIKIVKDKGFSNKEAEQIFHIMKYHCGEGVEINIEFVEEIPKTASSKYRFIVSNVGGDGDL